MRDIVLFTPVTHGFVFAYASSNILKEVNKFILVKPLFDARDCYLSVNRRLNASPRCKQKVGGIYE